MKRVTLWWAAGAVIAVGCSACAVLSGLSDLILTDGLDGASEAGAQVGPDATSGDAAAEAAQPPCQPATATDGAGLLFVNGAMGSDDGGPPVLGTTAAPFKTIGAALAFARANAATHIYVAAGTYGEQITFPSDFPDGAAPVVIEGGWSAPGGIWQKVCTPGQDPRSLTVIQSPAPVGVQAANVRNGSGLETLTVTSAPAGATPSDTGGGSSVGVWVSGDQSSFTLSNVVVSPGPGGAGGAAAAGAEGVDAGYTDGGGKGGGGNMPPDCMQRPPPCADGGPGVPGSPGTPAATGAFSTSNGAYVPGDGNAGGNGGTGNMGAFGAPGASGSCVSCGIASPCVNGPSCLSFAYTGVGAGGRCGCHGGGGGGGGAGRGGGASIALLASGAGTLVSLKATWLRASAGGDGSAGGPGGTGSSGAPGSPGYSVTCETTCGSTVCPFTCNAGNSRQLAAGGPGGAGGAGGNGGNGSGGAGGSSCSVARVNGATVAADGASRLDHAGGGAGAPPGDEASYCP